MRVAKQKQFRTHKTLKLTAVILFLLWDPISPPLLRPHLVMMASLYNIDSEASQDSKSCSKVFANSLSTNAVIVGDTLTFIH